MILLDRRLVKLASDGIQQESMEDRMGGLCPVVDHERLLKEEEEEKDLLKQEDRKEQ